MEQLNSETVAIQSTVNNSQAVNQDSKSPKIRVASSVQRNGRRKLEDRHVVENDLNAAFDLDVSVCFTA